MNNWILKIVLISLIFSHITCTHQMSEMPYYPVSPPGTSPKEFIADLVPSGMLIHKGVLHPNLKDFYYTISDPEFDRFDIYVIQYENEAWSKPRLALFNSEFSDHGMSFSLDGQTVYFSSTRPTGIQEIPSTWHLWMSHFENSHWSEPQLIDIPNMRDRLVSHPSITKSGALYFHASNLDYSGMDIYRSQLNNGHFGEAQKLNLPMTSIGRCTPYISPDEDFLIFAAIRENLDLMICHSNGAGLWGSPRKLPQGINSFGQGNPHVTSDQKYLFFTTEGTSNLKWQVKWVNIESALKL